jgi:hypothetical protein
VLPNIKQVISMSKSIDYNNKSLSQTDILTILSAADSIIGLSGRTMLAKILKGSRGKKLLGLKFDACSSYGAFRDETIEAISREDPAGVGCLVDKGQGGCGYVLFERSEPRDDFAVS